MHYLRPSMAGTCQKLGGLLAWALNNRRLSSTELTFTAKTFYTAIGFYCPCKLPSMVGQRAGVFFQYLTVLLHSAKNRGLQDFPRDSGESYTCWCRSCKPFVQTDVSRKPLPHYHH